MLLLLILLAAAVTVSCSDGGEARSVACELFGNCTEAGMFEKCAAEGENGYISGERMCELYGKAEGCREMGYIEDYCIIYSRRQNVREVHVLKARTESECRDLAAMLNRRAELLTKGEYVPAGGTLFGTKASRVRVETRGKLAILVAE